MTQSTLLALPYIAAAQAQKHVTHNEAIRELDALVQLAVRDRHLAAAPANPAEGDRYVVAPAATGVWAGQDNKVAAFQDGTWMFYAPQEGWIAWVADEAALYVYKESAWEAVNQAIGSTDQVGINTSASTENRLAVASSASLFTHEGAGHQLKINRHAATDTASVVFQTNFSGRAEIGTMGDGKFRVKTSTDGAVWSDQIVLDPSTGALGIGTVAPTSRLHLAGAASGAGTAGLRIDYSDTAAGATRTTTFNTQFTASTWRTYFAVAGASGDQGLFQIFTQDGSKVMLAAESNSANAFGRIFIYDRNNTPQIEARANASASFLNVGTSGSASGELRIQGTKVIGARGAAVADAAGGATVDVEARAAINALLARLRASTGHGLIA